MKNFSKQILCILIGFLLITPVNAVSTLIPGGQVIGLELMDNTVTVTALDENLGSAAEKAGIRQGDRILQINDSQIRNAEDIRNALLHSDGTVELTLQRGTKTKNIQFSPVLTDNGPKLGLYLRQGTTGIGTVTYYDPETGAFAALGHGVNDSKGNLLTMHTGSAYDAKVMSVKKGKIGTPGQLMGALESATAIGTLKQNCSQGIFGTLDTAVSGEPLPVADPESVHTGAATIYSTVTENTPGEYSVEILKIYPNATERCRNMLLKITDPALLNTTGGIVQGMGVSYNRDNTGNPNSLRGFQVTDP